MRRLKCYKRSYYYDGEERSDMAVVLNVSLLLSVNVNVNVFVNVNVDKNVTVRR